MAESVWARFRRHRWLPQATGVLVLAALVAGLVVVRLELRDDHNDEVLARACGGVLPPDAVRSVLAKDSWWKLRTGPGPRGLVACALTGDDERDPSLEVTAVPVLDAPLTGVDVGEITGSSPYENPPEWALAHERATTQVTVPCPKGLPGYARPVDELPCPRVAARLHGRHRGRGTAAGSRRGPRRRRPGTERLRWAGGEVGRCAATAARR